jgi:ABC-type polysaccharide/polyol phosphate transport system ATPase subunit
MAEVIRLENVVKRYRLGAERSNLRVAIPWRRHDPLGTGTTITAVDDFSMEVEEGEALGIVGDNGVGKSTLLKLIAGVIAPTEGRVMTRGRVASIIELGVGFHEDLTGSENLEFTAALMGMSRPELRRRRDAIIDFSGISYAMDTPVKRYSSGMLARLGFAVATHVDADIVLVDEVLSVGDLDFQRLSLERLAELNGEGVTTVLISHNLAAIMHLCTRVMRLDDGHMVADDTADKVVIDYAGGINVVTAGIGRIPVKLGDLSVDPLVLDPAAPFTIECDIEVERPMPRGRLQLILRPTPELLELHGHTNELATAGNDLGIIDIDTVTLIRHPVPSDVLEYPGKWTIKGSVGKFPMFPGSYSFDLLLFEEPHELPLDFASCVVEVPGLTPRHERMALPVDWSVNQLQES